MRFCATTSGLKSIRTTTRFHSQDQSYGATQVVGAGAVDGTNVVTAGDRIDRLRDQSRQGALSQNRLSTRLGRRKYGIYFGVRPMKCFVISPTGDEGSDIRLHAEEVFNHPIEQAFTHFGIEPVRSDHMNEPGSGDEQIQPSAAMIAGGTHAVALVTPTDACTPRHPVCLHWRELTEQTESPT